MNKRGPHTYLDNAFESWRYLQLTADPGSYNAFSVQPRFPLHLSLTPYSKQSLVVQHNREQLKQDL